MTADQRRSAALLLWPESAGDLDEAALQTAAPAFPRRLPPAPARFAQAVAFKLGRREWERDIVEPLMEARRAALGERAQGSPRALVRVDEFPHARAFDPAGRFGTDAFRRFHAVLTETGVPYLLAITPRVSRDYLDPEVGETRPLDDGEIETLQALQRDGVVFALHGQDHRTRHASPRRHSEFCGLGPAAAAERVEAALAVFTELGLRVPVFVPPFNRFDAAQYAPLAERFEVVCAGPETIRLLGFSKTPVWRGDAVYLPSYPPLYSRAAEVTPAIERLAALRAALWAPVTLHWGWELDDEFAALRRLCGALEGNVSSWETFLAAAAASRSF